LYILLIHSFDYNKELVFMKKLLLVLSSLLIVTGTVQAQDQANQTKRVAQFANDKVNVWKTIIYPKSNQALTMHRHDHDRVVVALTDGLLKITTNTGKTHNIKLEKNKAYYLAKDVPNELHSDENLTDHAIKVMVVEFTG
jgi:hypothetical protein